MQKIMESIFEIPYLLGVVALGILTIRASAGRLQFKLFGVMAVILGVGDAFHLVPRMYALWTDGIASNAASLGIGKMVTSITMTVFYALMFHVWQARYKKKVSRLSFATVHLLAAARVALCLFPQNQWTSPDAPLAWGIYRNLPFVALGAMIVGMYRSESERGADRAFRRMWLAIALSFAFYVPVVLWADIVPLLGMLMIPKTCAYVWIVWMGYSASKPAVKAR